MGVYHKGGVVKPPAQREFMLKETSSKSKILITPVCVWDGETVLRSYLGDTWRERERDEPENSTVYLLH